MMYQSLRQTIMVPGILSDSLSEAGDGAFLEETEPPEEENHSNEAIIPQRQLTTSAAVFFVDVVNATQKAC
jgi:hypothetical protein